MKSGHLRHVKYPTQRSLHTGNGKTELRKNIVVCGRKTKLADGLKEIASCGVTYG